MQSPPGVPNHHGNQQTENRRALSQLDRLFIIELTKQTNDVLIDVPFPPMYAFN